MDAETGKCANPLVGDGPSDVAFGEVDLGRKLARQQRFEHRPHEPCRRARNHRRRRTSRVDGRRRKGLGGQQPRPDRLAIDPGSSAGVRSVASVTVRPQSPPRATTSGSQRRHRNLTRIDAKSMIATATIVAARVAYGTGQRGWCAVGHWRSRSLQHSTKVARSRVVSSSRSSTPRQAGSRATPRPGVRHAPDRPSRQRSSYDLVPDLASSCLARRGDRTWTFALRQGINTPMVARWFLDFGLF